MHMLHMHVHSNKLFFPRLKHTLTFFFNNLSNKIGNTKRQYGSSHAMGPSNQVTKEKCQARTTIFVRFLFYDSKIEEHLR